MYKRGHAVTYLLLKESVANNVINVSLFAYDKIMLKTLNVNKRTQDIGKKCPGIKKVRGETIKEFPNKKWSKCGVEDFLKLLRTTQPLNEHPVVDVRGRGVVCRPVSTLKADILNITYD